MYQQARWNLGSKINVSLAPGLPFNYTIVVADVDTWCIIYPAGGWGPDMFTLRLLEKFIEDFINTPLFFAWTALVFYRFPPFGIFGRREWLLLSSCARPGKGKSVRRNCI